MIDYQEIGLGEICYYLPPTLCEDEFLNENEKLLMARILREYPFYTQTNTNLRYGVYSNENRFYRALNKLESNGYIERIPVRDNRSKRVIRPLKHRYTIEDGSGFMSHPDIIT